MMWPPSSSSSSSSSRQLSTPHHPQHSYGLSSHPEMGMFVVAPATSFHHTSTHDSLMPSSSHHHDPTHHHHFTSSNAAAHAAATALGVGVGVGVIPLLTTTPCLNMGGGGSVGGIDDSELIGGNRSRGGSGAVTASGMHLWQGNGQHHSQHHQQQVNSLSRNKGAATINFDQNSMNLLAPGSGGDNTGGGGGGTTSGGGGGMGSGSGGTMTCQDCGNQAKKDCTHRRCRTCCRSRGFDCSTHVKSTWVPAARRRERQSMGAAGGSGCGGGGASSGSTSGAKKPRLVNSKNTTATSHTSTPNTPPRSFDTSSSHQDVGFKEALPGQVRAPAVFKCVRVTAVEDGGEPEFAYQAVVKINGHVFKGFLYDQGVDHAHQQQQQTSRSEGFPNISELHLGGAGSSSGGRNGGGGGGTSPLDPSDVYGAAASGGGLLGGATFGNTMN